MNNSNMSRNLSDCHSPVSGYGVRVSGFWKLCLDFFLFNPQLTGRLILHTTMWCCLFLMLLAIEGHAYYHQGEKSEQLFFQKERAYAQWGEGERSFVIYDNFTNPMEKYRQDPVIRPRSDEFMPADVISGNLPIRIAIRYPLSVENSLSNLLYANLKLKGLIEKYRALQQTSRELMTGLTVPNRRSSSAAFQRQDLKQGSVYRQKEELEMEYGSMKKNAAPPGLSGNSDLAVLVSTESLVFLLNESTKMEGTPLSLFVHPEAEEKRKKALDDPSAYYYKDSVQSIYIEKPSLPWVFQAIFDTLRYLLSHWFETLVYGTIFLLLIIGVWLIRPR